MATPTPTPPPVLATTWQWWYYRASGGEVVVHTPLIGDVINKFTRDGIKYRPVVSDPGNKEFVYNDITGDISFSASSPALETNEVISIQHLNAVTTPQISNITVTAITDTSVTINWTTDIASDSTVEYWVIGGSVFSVTDGTLVTSHSITLTGLIAGTTYTFHVISVDADGNTFTSSDFTFTTTGSSGAPDTTPPVISNINSSVTSNSATITWDTDELANSRVEFGLTTSYGSVVSNSTLVLAHSILLTGLTANTTYHYRVRSVDAAGNISYSTDHTFTTSGIISTTTQFGVILGDADDSLDVKINVSKQISSDHIIRGAHETLSTYTSGQGSGLYNKCQAQNMRMIHNLNWNQNGSPTNLFCHDETLYKSKLNLVLNDYAADSSVVIMVVIENEPDNQGYYGDTMANYITQLGWAIEVCHARTPKVLIADGCCHIIGIMQLVNGGSGGLAGQIVTGINNLRLAGKVLDYVNLHTNLSASNSSAAVRNFIDSAQYLREHTGIQKVISNEWHLETADSTYAVQAVADSRTANLYYSVPFGGDCPWVTTKAYPFNCGLTLTAMGTDIKNAIALP